MIFEKMSQKMWLELRNVLKALNTIIEDLHDLGDNIFWVGRISWDQRTSFEDEI